MKFSRGTPSLEQAHPKDWLPILICLFLVILTVTAFWQLKDCGFINIDDNRYVYENAYVQSGLNWNSVRYTFSFDFSNWHPVTWLSYMLDHSIFGLNPQGYHLINLLFHVMNTLLLFLILCRMTKRLWPSAFVAALFAIHPLHVESVAWIAERKDVLSTFFWMLTLGAYSYYVEHPGFKRYLPFLLFFVLGLLAKPMLVTLPFVLLLLDYWPLNRFSETTGIKPSAARDCSTYPILQRFACGIGVSTIKPDSKVQAEILKSATSDKQKKKSKKRQAITAREISQVKKPADPEYSWSRLYPLLWEKVPLFVLAILSSIVTYIAQQKGGAVASIEAFPLGVRIGNAFVSYIAYMGKMIWPSNLAVLYPHPGLLASWQVLGSVLLLVVITLAVFWKAKKSPYLLTGWLWYLGTLVPVIGIVQVGAQAMADRYTYIPLIGLFIIVAWGVPDLLKKWKYRKETLLALAALIILGLSIKTWTQSGYWQSSITLYDHTLKVTDDNWRICNNRGAAYQVLGNYRQAIEDYNRAIEINPNYVDAYSNRGIVYGVLGNYRQAIEDYNRVIEINPSYADAYYMRGIACQSLGNYKQAIEDYGRAIEINTGYAGAYNNRGFVYLNQGDKISGCRDAQKACELGNCKLLETATVKGLCR